MYLPKYIYARRGIGVNVPVHFGSALFLLSLCRTAAMIKKMNSAANRKAESKKRGAIGVAGRSTTNISIAVKMERKSSASPKT